MVIFSLSSGNTKTGPIPVSTSSKDTCPDVCPLKGKGCYALLGHLNIHWERLTAGLKGITFKAFLNEIRKLPKGKFWRHNQAGDLEGKGDKICAKSLKALVNANKGRHGFTYTHKPVLGDTKLAKANAELVKYANANGFTVNLSSNNLAHADNLKALGIAPVVVILPWDASANVTTPAGNKVVICPAVTKGITCEHCQLCQKQRDSIVGFPAHGIQKKKVSEVAKGNC